MTLTGAERLFGHMPCAMKGKNAKNAKIVYIQTCAQGFPKSFFDKPHRYKQNYEDLRDRGSLPMNWKWGLVMNSYFSEKWGISSDVHKCWHLDLST